MLSLDPRTTALVLIDLQKGIVALPGQPRPCADVVGVGKGLAAAFRAAGAPVVLVNVAFSPDGGDQLKAPVDDQPPPRVLPADWAVLIDGLAQPGDILVTKHHWGAFYGTDLELQLRRRGVETIVIGGIATNFGVESTVRVARELGFSVVVVEDACASLSTELHEFAIKAIFPRIARVRSSTEVALTEG